MIRTFLRPGAYAVFLALAACGKQPIEAAVEKNDRTAVSEAVKSGADVNAIVSNGDTPLLLAAKTGQSSSAQALIEAGADIKVHDDAAMACSITRRKPA